MTGNATTGRIHDFLHATHTRRLHLSTHTPVCPDCDSLQVQLMAYIATTPAQWRCRRCRTHFTYEPAEAAT